MASSTRVRVHPPPLGHRRPWAGGAWPPSRRARDGTRRCGSRSRRSRSGAPWRAGRQPRPDEVCAGHDVPAMLRVPELAMPQLRRVPSYSMFVLPATGSSTETCSDSLVRAVTGTAVYAHSLCVLQPTASRNLHIGTYERTSAGRNQHRRCDVARAGRPPEVSDVDELPIGRRVAYWRNRRKMSQQVFADRLGKSKSWVDKVERGVRRLDKFSVVYEIADVLQLDVQLLLGKDPERRPDTRQLHRPGRGRGDPGGAGALRPDQRVLLRRRPSRRRWPRCARRSTTPG